MSNDSRDQVHHPRGRDRAGRRRFRHRFEDIAHRCCEEDAETPPVQLLPGRQPHRPGGGVMEPQDTTVDALRHAVRTQPMNEWCLVDASRAMYGTRDYDRIRARSYGFNWTFTGDVLDALVDEGWLHRPDGIHYVPTDAAKTTWPVAP